MREFPGILTNVDIQNEADSEWSVGEGMIEGKAGDTIIFPEGFDVLLLKKVRGHWIWGIKRHRWQKK